MCAASRNIVYLVAKTSDSTPVNSHIDLKGKGKAVEEKVEALDKAKSKELLFLPSPPPLPSPISTNSTVIYRMGPSRCHKIVLSSSPAPPSPLRPNGLLKGGPLEPIAPGLGSRSRSRSGSRSGLISASGSNSGVAALASRTDVKVALGLGSGLDVESRVQQRSGESYVRDLPLAKRSPGIVLEQRSPGIVLALEQKLAKVNQELADVKARKETLEELIVEFGGEKAAVVDAINISPPPFPGKRTETFHLGYVMLRSVGADMDWSYQHIGDDGDDLLIIARKTAHAMVSDRTGSTVYFPQVSI